MESSLTLCLDETPILNSKTFRFKFSDTITDLLLDFGQQHKYDTKEEFKEQWDIWTTENQEEINIEKRRLDGIGYNGNIIIKMYKSVRYYYIKKNSVSTVKREKRKKYIHKNILFINVIDEFIRTHIIKNEETNTLFCNLKPSIGWKLFLDSHTDLVENEVIRVQRDDETINRETAFTKAIKTFNNRYYIIIKR